MKYSDLINIYRNNTPENDDTDNPAVTAVGKILSPRPLENLEELEQLVSLSFRYIGQGNG